MVIKFFPPEFVVFTNSSAHAVEYDGVLYPTSEHAYMAAKCTDAAGKEEIRAARSPVRAKALANGRYRHARDPEWDSRKVAVMEAILRAKLAQHEEARDALLKTGDEDIVEYSATDYFWGEGADGTGLNMLGKIWMKLRQPPA